jgi:hypothetical protein
MATLGPYKTELLGRMRCSVPVLRVPSLVASLCLFSSFRAEAGADMSHGAIRAVKCHCRFSGNHLPNPESHTRL